MTSIQIKDHGPIARLSWRCMESVWGISLRAGGRAAGGNEPAHGFGGQHAALAVLDPADPGTKVIVITRRNAPGKLLGRADVAKPVLAANAVWALARRYPRRIRSCSRCGSSSARRKAANAGPLERNQAELARAARLPYSGRWKHLIVAASCHPEVLRRIWPVRREMQILRSTSE